MSTEKKTRMVVTLRGNSHVVTGALMDAEDALSCDWTLNDVFNGKWGSICVPLDDGGMAYIPRDNIAMVTLQLEEVEADVESPEG